MKMSIDIIQRVAYTNDSQPVAGGPRVVRGSLVFRGHLPGGPRDQLNIYSI